ncbi:MAG TPA: efflux RND transporter periplasmic adaptor subunit [Verrucomicrobiae bacterium]|nr:efflux RND transporter periplasmic adaptor subunit [Verrucomicrobiae bacterium]
MKRKTFIGILIVVAVLVVLAGVKVLQIRSMIAFGKSFAMPPETISSAVAHEEKWQDTLSAVGSVNADQGVIVSPEIAGTVSEIDFESGATVKKGDLLLKLDASSEEAQLRAAESQVELAKLNADRSQKLRADNTVSQSELDQAEATLKQAQANADTIRSTIDKKTIRAPFDGRLGIRLVNLGEQLDVGKGIVSLQSLTPVFVDFSLPQQDLSQLATGLKVSATSDAYPSNSFDGELAAINPDLDAMTRSVRLRAKFENADQLLRPGMFVRAEIILPEAKPVLAIPSTAILSATFGDSVFLIMTAAQAGITNMPATNLVAQQKFIRTGRAHGDFVSVESGLKAGDKVATAGLLKLRNGVSVKENNEDSPKPSLSPTPPNS